MSYNPNDNKQPYSSLTSEKGLEAEPAYTAGFQAGLSARSQKKEGCFKASFCGYFRRRGRQFSVFKREYVEEMLANNFPKRTLIVSAIIIFFMSITAFSLQVTMIAKRAPYFRPGAGIWVGILFAIFEIFTLLLICKRKRSLLLVTYGLHVFGLILSSVGLFVVNYYGVSRPCYDKDHLDFSDCKNSRFFGFNVAMFVIAGFYFVSCLAEIISIRRRLNQSREKILGNQEASAPIV